MLMIQRELGPPSSTVQPGIFHVERTLPSLYCLGFPVSSSMRAQKEPWAGSLVPPAGLAQAGCLQVLPENPLLANLPAENFLF